MPLFSLVVLAVLQGLAEALPVSPSGHSAVARLWLDAVSDGGSAPLPPSTVALEATLSLGTALALGVVSRRRLFAALSDGVRAIARPALFRTSPGARDAVLLILGSAVSLLVSRFVSPLAERFHDVPVAVGLGLIVTGFALASTLAAPRAAVVRLPVRRRDLNRPDAPSTVAIVAVGAVHGLAVFPGASRVGAALIVLLWVGVRPGRALDLAFLLTLPSLLGAFFFGLSGRAGDVGIETGAVIVGLLLAFLAAILATAALRALLDRRRLGALALWIVPLGLAMLAYARALPPA
jgi:undecaprenyl-diphosphatase